MDDLFEYLVATDQLDAFLGVKEEQQEESNDDENIEEQ